MNLCQIFLTLLLVIPALTVGNLRLKPVDPIKTIAIIGTNDIHGTAFPQELLRTDTNQKYKYGGLVYMGRLMEIIKNQHKDSVLYFDGGDQFQGGIESSQLTSNGEIISDFFNILGLAGSSIGNHEFDFGPAFLNNFFEKKNSPSLAANLESEKGERNFLPKHESIKMYQVGDIKIGVIGLATIESPMSTSGFVDKLFPQYKFLPYKDIVIQYSGILKEQGANAVLIVSHVGNECPQNKTYDIRTKDTPQEACYTDELTNLIDVIPEGTIDGIVSGHRHRWIHHYYKGIPFMGNINGGYYFNVLYLNFNVFTKKIVDSAIQGPIPVCQKLFLNTLTCEYQDDEALKTAGPLVEWKFHNKPVYAHPEADRVFKEKWVPLMSDYFALVCQNEVLLERVRDGQNPLANLMTSMMQQAAPEVDFSMINHGAFRTTWFPGDILEKHFYAMFPFKNQIQTFSITGAELKEMLEVIQGGFDGFYYFWNIKQYVSLTAVTNPDGSQNLKKGYINATMADGTPIEDEKMYRGVTISFNLNGGDDFINVIGKVFTPRDVQNIGDQREVLVKEFKKLGIIKKGEWIDPENPRMVVVNN